MTKLEFPVHKSRYRFAISAMDRIKKARRRPLLHTAYRSRRTSLKRRRYGNKIFAQLQRQVRLLVSSRLIYVHIASFSRKRNSLRWRRWEWIPVRYGAERIMNEMFRSFCCLSNITERPTEMRQETEGKKREREALVDRWKGSRGKFALVVSCSRRSGTDSLFTSAMWIFRKMIVQRLILFSLSILFLEILIFLSLIYSNLSIAT